MPLVIENTPEQLAYRPLLAKYGYIQGNYNYIHPKGYAIGLDLDGNWIHYNSHTKVNSSGSDVINLEKLLKSIHHM